MGSRLKIQVIDDLLEALVQQRMLLQALGGRP
jgi:hypothetical protein